MIFTIIKKVRQAISIKRNIEMLLYLSSAAGAIYGAYVGGSAAVSAAASSGVAFLPTAALIGVAALSGFAALTVGLGALIGLAKDIKNLIYPGKNRSHKRSYALGNLSAGLITAGIAVSVTVATAGLGVAAAAVGLASYFIARKMSKWWRHKGLENQASSLRLSNPGVTGLELERLKVNDLVDVKKHNPKYKINEELYRDEINTSDLVTNNRNSLLKIIQAEKRGLINSKFKSGIYSLYGTYRRNKTQELALKYIRGLQNGRPNLECPLYSNEIQHSIANHPILLEDERAALKQSLGIR